MRDAAEPLAGKAVARLMDVARRMGTVKPGF